jgi:hypothetical protein
MLVLILSSTKDLTLVWENDINLSQCSIRFGFAENARRSMRWYAQLFLKKDFEFCLDGCSFSQKLRIQLRNHLHILRYLLPTIGLSGYA